MRFKLNCVDWKDENGINDGSNGYYIKDDKSKPYGYYEIVEINTLEDLLELTEKYKKQWTNKYNGSINSRDMVINFDEREILIYNGYIE